MNRILLIIIAIALVVAGYFFFMHKPAPVAVSPSPAEVPGEVTLVGFWECVPKKPGVPHTEECMAGIALDQSDGHVVVDSQFFPSPAEIDPGTKVQIKGIFTPATYLSASHWQTYDIDGIISATSIDPVQ